MSHFIKQSFSVLRFKVLQRYGAHQLMNNVRSSRYFQSQFRDRFSRYMAITTSRSNDPFGVVVVDRRLVLLDYGVHAHMTAKTELIAIRVGHGAIVPEV